MKKYYYHIILLLLTGCKQAYIAPVKYAVNGYLVVEGFINNGPTPTSIQLSRSNMLPDSAKLVYEHNATVEIESDNNEIFPLAETGNGVYTYPPMTLNKSEKYRLHIKTVNQEEYLSDFQGLQDTPPIDSISWVRENGDGDVQININAHDPTNTLKYYLWRYEETWEFHSILRYIIYVEDQNGGIVDVRWQYEDPGPRFHDADTSIYKCWKTPSSTNVLTGSTDKLGTDRVFLPLRHIARSAEELSVLYSVKLHFFAISHPAYIFFGEIKKNSEQLGSIFDAQPSVLQGNIHCINDPAEIVIGFVDVSTEQTKRIFISGYQVPDWNYHQCSEQKIARDPKSIADNDYLMPTSFAEDGYFLAAYPECVDCTLTGSHMKPAFWP